MLCGRYRRFDVSWLDRARFHLFSVNAEAGIRELEEFRILTNALGWTHLKKAAGLQGVVKGFHDLALQVQVKIDQDVAAADQIEPRVGRVIDEVVAGENA